MTESGKEMGNYTLTVKNKENEVVCVRNYHSYMSGTAMMDEAFSYSRIYPESQGYKVEW